MTIVNALMQRLVGVLLSPFQDLPAIVGLSVVSLLTAIGMLVVFKATSDQRRLGDVKRGIQACLFEIRLFSDDLRAIMRAQAEILRHNATYLRLSLVPMLWIIVPLVLVIAQLQFYYGYAGLEPGHSALVKVRLKSAGAATQGGTGGSPGVALEAPAGLRVETPPVWIPALRETAWRIGAERQGEYELRVTVNRHSSTKTVRVSQGLGWRSPERLERRFLNQLLYPAEPALSEDAPFESIAVTYPARDVNVLGWELHWMLVFFVLSMVFAFALRNRFGVVI